MGDENISGSKSRCPGEGGGRLAQFHRVARSKAVQLMKLRGGRMLLREMAQGRQ